jgi:hypothetical protein
VSYFELDGEIASDDGTTRMAGIIRLDRDALMGFVLSQLHLTTFDNSDAGASVAGSTTATVRTINGKGAADVVLDGTGSADVTIKYSVDGGADTAIGTSDQALYIALAFTTSLVLKATNANAAARNRCGISSTGVTQ